MYVESGYNVVRVSIRIVLRIGPPSYTILVRSCVSLCCCCTVVCGLRSFRVIINQVKQKLHLVGYLLIRYPIFYFIFSVFEIFIRKHVLGLYLKYSHVLVCYAIAMYFRLY